MKSRFFVRLMGAAVCVAAFATSDEAEAGRRHRRHTYDACCTPVCCDPVCCDPVCVTECAPSCCGGACEMVAWYDSCGRLVYRRAACCETIVSSTILVPAASCCGQASAGSTDAGSMARTPATESLTATPVSVGK